MTNREKLEELRRQAVACAETCGVQSNEGRINASFRIMSELLGLLIGADGPRSPLADAERADKLTLARDSVTAARAFVDEVGSSRPPMIQAVSQTLTAIWSLADVLAAEPAPRRICAPELQPGDVVRLRSGGPAMTVLAELEDQRLGCSWFRDSDVLAGSFPPAALIRIADEQKAAQRERDRRSILVDAERTLNDVRLVAHDGALAEQLVGIRDGIAAALAEDAS